MLSISALSYRIALCTMADVVTTGGIMTLTRNDAFTTWAAIEQKKKSSFSREGYTIDESLATQTHEIYIRYRPEIEVTTTAWIYEERGLSAPRWYKVLKSANYKEESEWFCFSCRLTEASDDVSKPQYRNELDLSTSLPPGIDI